jgi:hypothetical protein
MPAHQPLPGAMVSRHVTFGDDMAGIPGREP